MVEEGARREGRVVLRLTPYATFHSPPKHVHGASDVNEKLLARPGRLAAVVDSRRDPR